MIPGFLIALAGAVLLSVSMKKHYRQLFPERTLTVAMSRVLRAAGYLLLVASAWACVSTKGVAVGLTWFAGLLTVAFFTLAISLPVIDRRVR